MQHYVKQYLTMALQHKRDLVILWTLFSTFLLLFGGAINPLTAGEQFNRRIHLSSLLDPMNPDINALNELFEHFLQESEQYVNTRDRYSTITEYEAHMVEIFTFLSIKHKPDLMEYLTIDHFPTVGEVMRAKVDDRDGRTIFAASIMLYRGYNAWALFGPWHSWVEIILENSTHLRILEKKGIGMNFWYLKFNDQEVHFKHVETLVFIYYELVIAALTVGVLFYVWKTFSTSSFVRQVVKGLSAFVVLAMILFIVSIVIILIFYRIMWGV